MRIAVNTLSVLRGETGGGETYLVNLVRSMARISPGDEFALVVSAKNRCGFERLGRNTELTEIPGPFRSRPARVLYERIFLGRTMDRLKPDVIFMPGNAGLPAPSRPEVVAVQSLLHVLAPREVGLFRRLYFSSVLAADLGKATLVLAVSHNIARKLTERLRVPPEKIRVVHEGVSTSFAPVKDQKVVSSALEAARARPPYLLLVGGLKRYRNADKAILALARLNKTLDTPRQLLVVGPDRGGVRPELTRLAKEAGVAEHVRFAGAVPHEDLAAYYSGAEALVFPSSIESFGLPVLEAMACGTPVVASDFASLPEIVGDAGLLVDPDDIRAFAAALERVINDRKLSRRLTEKGFERVRHFSWERCARETLSVLAEASGESTEWQEARAQRTAEG